MWWLAYKRTSSINRDRCWETYCIVDSKNAFSDSGLCHSLKTHFYLNLALVTVNLFIWTLLVNHCRQGEHAGNKISRWTTWLCRCTKDVCEKCIFFKSCCQEMIKTKWRLEDGKRGPNWGRQEDEGRWRMSGGEGCRGVGGWVGIRAALVSSFE